MSVNRIALGKRISFYRLKFSMTQEKLADLTNCSREYIWSYRSRAHSVEGSVSILMNTIFMGLSSLVFIYPAAPPKFMPNLCGIIAIHSHRCIVECCQQVLLDVPNLSAVFF